MWKKVLGVSTTTLLILAMTFPGTYISASAFSDNYFPTYEIDNLVQNGDLSNGINGWNDVGFITYDSGRLKVTFQYSGESIYQHQTYILNHYYYIYFINNSNNNTTLRVRFGTNQIVSNITNNVGDNIFSVVSQSTQIDNTVFRILNLNTVTPTTHYFDNLIIIDVTKFNSTYSLNWGKTEFDNIIAKYGYFDKLSIDLPVQFDIDTANVVGNSFLNKIQWVKDLPTAMVCTFDRFDILGIIETDESECHRTRYVLNPETSNGGGGGGFRIR